MRLRLTARRTAACALGFGAMVACWPIAGRAALLSPPPAAGTAPPQSCVTPPDMLQPDEILPGLSASLHAAGRLDILALGSGMMAGPDGQLESSFPYRMAQIIEAAVPGLQVRLNVTAGKGITADEMLASMREDLAAGHYGLVLWQTGTVEAVRRLPVQAFRATLAAGAQAVHGAGAELVLIDPPYGPALRVRAHLDPYIDALRDAGKETGVVLFRRYDVMRGWALSGEFDPEHAPRAQRGDTLDVLHECLANALARLVLRAGGQNLR